MPYGSPLGSSLATLWKCPKRIGDLRDSAYGAVKTLWEMLGDRLSAVSTIFSNCFIRCKNLREKTTCQKGWRSHFVQLSPLMCIRHFASIVLEEPRFCWGLLKRRSNRIFLKPLDVLLFMRYSTLPLLVELNLYPSHVIQLMDFTSIPFWSIMYTQYVWIFVIIMKNLLPSPNPRKNNVLLHRQIFSIFIFF